MKYLQLNFDKKNLPGYIFKFNVVFTAFIIGWFVVCVPLCVAIGCVYDESPVTYGVMIGAFSLFFIGLAVFLIVWQKLRKKLQMQRFEEITRNFSDMPLEQAEEILKAEAVIKDGGFVCGDDAFGTVCVPFDKTAVYMDAGSGGTQAFLEIAAINLESKELIAFYTMDNALFNFIMKKNIELINGEMFRLFEKDKKEFIELLFKKKLK